MQQIVAEGAARSCSDDVADAIPSIANRNIDQIEEQREDLRDARDDLLGARFRLKDQRKDMQAVREITVSQIAKAHDLMRRFILSQNLSVPIEVSTIWSDVDKLRDKLGEKEVGYDDAENRYDHQEWRYTEKEQKFVDAIFETRSEISEDSEGLPSVKYETKLGQFPDGSIHRDSNHSIGEDELHEFHLDPDLLISGSQPEIQVPTPDCVVENPGSYVQHQVTAANDDMLISNCHKVSSWMLHCLRASPLQRRLLELFLPTDTLDKREWWRKVLEHWETDEFESAAFHTGDTTISDSAFSQAVLIDLGEASHHVSEVDDLSGKQVAFVPLCSQRNSIYASEPVDTPSHINSKDLVDTPRHVHFYVQAHQSGPGLDHIAGKTPGMPTVHNNMPPRKPSRVEQTASDRELTNQAVMSEMSDEYAGQADDARLLISEFIYDARKPIDIGSTSSGSYDTNVSDDAYSIVSQQETQELQSTTLPQGKDQGDQLYPASKFWTRYPFASFVRVKGQKPWSLPLLRLTPLPHSITIHRSICNGYNRVDEMPFVQLGDTPIQLPGPS